MPLSIQIVTPPIIEPVTLNLAKQHLRVDFDDDDVLISAYIIAARQYCEKYTRRAFFNQTWLRTLDYFPLWYSQNGTVNPAYRADWPYYADFWARITIDLPTPRTIGVTQITYLDTFGNLNTLPPAAYNVDTTSVPARIVPSQGTYWPTVMTYQPGSVRITYTAGSYVQKVTETFTVPAAAPYTYTLLQSLQLPVTAVDSVLDANGNTPTYTYSAGVLTLTAASAGLTYTVTYWVGSAPQTIVMAMLLLIAHWYEHREGASELNLKNIPLGVSMLLDTEKLQVWNYRP
jgi:hypothetical protein